MALNREVFKTRTLSAIVYVAVMLSGLLWNHWSFLVLFLLIHAGCWVEYIRLMEKIFAQPLHRFMLMGCLLTGYSIMLAFCGKAFALQGYWLSQALCLPLAVAGFLLLVMGVLRQRNINVRQYGAVILGWVYISLAWGTMLGLRQQGMVFKGDTMFLDAGRVWPLVLIASIWINDTMQYIVGSLIGKTPFSKISPKKTWEGTAGGSVLAIVSVGFFCWQVLHLPAATSFGIAAVGAIVGTLGDLLESFFKRSAGVKDSGNMLPGHGGFLDRFDSMLLATPVAYLLVLILQGT